MSVSSEIARLQDIRDRQQAKLSAMGLTADTATLEDCTDAVEGITDNGAVSAELTEVGEPYTIPKGYHDGNGTVSLSAALIASIAASSKGDFDTGEVTLTAPVGYNSPLVISHSLGKVPSFVFVVAVAGWEIDTDYTYTVICGVTINANGEIGSAMDVKTYYNTQRVNTDGTASGVNSGSNGVVQTSSITDTEFTLRTHSETMTWNAGATVRWFVM